MSLATPDKIRNLQRKLTQPQIKAMFSHWPWPWEIFPGLGSAAGGSMDAFSKLVASVASRFPRVLRLSAAQALSFSRLPADFATPITDV
jgi:hypothetical protein